MGKSTGVSLPFSRRYHGTYPKNRDIDLAAKRRSGLTITSWARRAAHRKQWRKPIHSEHSRSVMKVQIDTAQNVAIEYDVATSGERIGAFAIDLAIMGIYTYIVFIVSFGFSLRESDELYQVVLLVMFVPILFYYPLSEILMHGQSLGKRIVKIKVVRLDGTPPDIGSYLLRWLLSYVEIYPVAGSVALLALLANGKGQRLGDIAAGTTVIKIPQVLRLKQTPLALTDDSYTPTYPQVTQLSDRDVAIIREVMGSRERSRNPSIINTLAQKIEEILDVRNSSAPLPFLRTVIKDYNYYTSRMG